MKRWRCLNCGLWFGFMRFSSLLWLRNMKKSPLESPVQCVCVCISVMDKEYGLTVAVYQWLMCLTLSVCLCICTDRGDRDCWGGVDPSLAGCIVSYGGHNGISWSPSRAWDRLTKLGVVCAFCEGVYATCDSVTLCLVYVLSMQSGSDWDVFTGWPWRSSLRQGIFS